MKTTLLICQHNRCTKLLELIQECDKRITDYKKSVAYHEYANPFSPVIDHYYDRWQLTLKVKDRLVNSYSNSLAKIIKPVVDKMGIA